MEFLHASIALLASMVLVLAGMVGWLYWQQTRLFQNMNSIVMVIGELARPAPPAAVEETDVVPTTTETAPVPIPEDDRVSVEKEPVAETEPTAAVATETDTDDLEGKTKKELTDLLTKKGIPFSKSDTKSGSL